MISSTSVTISGLEQTPSTSATVSGLENADSPTALKQEDPILQNAHASTGFNEEILGLEIGGHSTELMNLETNIPNVGQPTVTIQIDSSLQKAPNCGLMTEANQPSSLTTSDPKQMYELNMRDTKTNNFIFNNCNVVINN